MICGEDKSATEAAHCWRALEANDSALASHIECASTVVVGVIRHLPFPKFFPCAVGNGLVWPRGFYKLIHVDCGLERPAELELEQFSRRNQFASFVTVSN